MSPRYKAPTRRREWTTDDLDVLETRVVALESAVQEIDRALDEVDLGQVSEEESLVRQGFIEMAKDYMKNRNNKPEAT